MMIAKLFTTLFQLCLQKQVYIFECHQRLRIRHCVAFGHFERRVPALLVLVVQVCVTVRFHPREALRTLRTSTGGRLRPCKSTSLRYRCHPFNQRPRLAHHPARCQKANAVVRAQCLFPEVRHDDGRTPAVLDKSPEYPALHRIQTIRGLVKNCQQRIKKQCCVQRQPFPFASRESPKPPPSYFVKPKLLSHRVIRLHTPKSAVHFDNIAHSQLRERGK